jgi:hypothetical protein
MQIGTNPTAESVESDLNQRSARLAAPCDPDQFARRAAAITELLRDHLARAASRQGPVWPSAGSTEVLERWPDPESGPRETLEHILADVLTSGGSLGALTELRAL